VRKYVTFTTHLRTFATGLGYVFLDQFRAEDVDSFYARSSLGQRAKGKMLEWLRGFFKFATYREWIPKSPVSPDLRPPIGASRIAHKVPFTDTRAPYGDHSGVVPRGHARINRERVIAYPMFPKVLRDGRSR
jgi:hypothetical protein